MTGEWPMPAAWLADRRLTMEQLQLLAYLAGFPEGHVYVWGEIACGMPYHRRESQLQAVRVLIRHGYVTITSREPLAFVLCSRAMGGQGGQVAAR
ncbi:hypothetical protein [Nonomuraea sp. NPDC052265]|uniref:hypothetical protein n=1 Tax=Nonomuraea sp. NPDC052265 TaxID=3364374 RepID=UPI0037C5DCE1